MLVIEDQTLSLDKVIVGQWRYFEDEKLVVGCHLLRVCPVYEVCGGKLKVRLECLKVCLEVHTEMLSLS